MSNYDWLADEPNKWGALTPEGYRTMWVPGAFGERDDIKNLEIKFKVIEDEWDDDDAGNVLRIIKKVEILDVAVRSTTREPDA